MNRTETIRLLSIVTTAYPSVELTSEQVELWVYMLQDVPYERGQANLKQHVLTSRFPPAISDVVGTDVAGNDYDRLRDDTAERFAEMERWEQQALPACPDHLRPKFLGRGKVVGD